MKRYLGPGLAVAGYTIFIAGTHAAGNAGGSRALIALIGFGRQMVLLLPFAFVLIGLFEVWVKRETVETYLGAGTGPAAYLLAIGLAGTTVGGLYVAFPLAWSLHKKGAKLAVVFTYLSAAGISRIPMTVFEASFMGLKFTIVRLAVSLPLVVAASWMMGSFLDRRRYALRQPGSTDKNGNAHGVKA